MGGELGCSDHNCHCYTHVNPASQWTYYLYTVPLSKLLSSGWPERENQAFKVSSQKKKSNQLLQTGPCTNELCATELGPFEHSMSPFGPLSAFSPF